MADVLKEVKTVIDGKVTFTTDNVLNFTQSSFGLQLTDDVNVALVSGEQGTFLVFEKAGNAIRRYTGKLVHVKTVDVV